MSDEAHGGVRLPLAGADLDAETLALPTAAAHYLLSVRRLAEGARLTVFDGRGREATVRLALSTEGPRLVREGPSRAGRAGAPVTLAYALPRSEKLDDVLRQVTELGVAGIHLFQAERSISKIEPGDRQARKRERWAKILEEAARQSGRADVPALTGPTSLAEALTATADAAYRAVLHPEGGRLLDAAHLAAPAAVFVGPEGGFSSAELARFDAAGVERLRLASPVLRTETAAVVGPALLLHHLGAL